MAKDYLKWQPAEVVNEVFEVTPGGVMTFEGRHLDTCCDLSDIDFYSRLWDSGL